MPTLAQGAFVDLTVAADSTLTLQSPNGGLVTVENPVGTVVWRGGESNRRIDLKGGIARVTANTRDVFYELATDPAQEFPVTFDPLTGLVRANGSTVSGAGKVAKARIAIVGDSIVEYGGDRQQITLTSNLYPFGGSAFSIVCVSWANGSGGTGTLTFNKAAQTLRWAAPGEAAGPAVDVSRAGRYTIPGLTPGKTVTVVCRPRLYSTATDGDASVTTTAGTSRAVKSGRTIYHWLHAKCRASFELTLLSNGGSIISDVVESMAWQIPDGYFDAIVLEPGTNDLSLDRTLDQMKSDTLAAIAVAKRKAPVVFVQSLLPRSLNMAVGVRRQTWSDFNRWITTLRISGVVPVNVTERILDTESLTASPGTNTLEDGLHPATFGAELVSEALYRAIADVFRFDESSVLSSQVDAYNAATNPTGNALPSGGTFTGSAGSFGTGCSGTLGTGWNLARESGANITAVASKVARPDGRPGFIQRIVLSNPGGASERVALSTESGSRPAISAGQIWNLKISQTPSSMVGVELMSAAMEPVPAAGEYTSTWGANAGAGTMSGSRSKLVMEPWPLTVPAGPTAMNTVLRWQLAAGGSVTIDLDPGEQLLWRDS